MRRNNRRGIIKHRLDSFYLNELRMWTNSIKVNHWNNDQTNCQMGTSWIWGTARGR